MKKYIFLLVIIALILVYLNYSDSVNFVYFSKNKEADGVPVEKLDLPVKKGRIEVLEISEGDTYGKVMDDANVDFLTAAEIYEAALRVYDLAKIRVGREIKLTYDKDSDELKSLNYKVDSEDELFVIRNKAASTQSDSATSAKALAVQDQYYWQAEIKPIPYEVKIKISEGRVETSMYEAALDNDIDIRAIIELANAFQWTIDFAMDPRVGDTFKFIYEERYLDGEYIMPGAVLAGKYFNDGQDNRIYYFSESEENTGFFDSGGNSVQKLFLKAPVAFKYISSGFTTGLRYIQAFNISTGHRAIDYAAESGTPVRAVGDGTISFLGWDNGYGQKISIHHNATYSTNYTHLSKYAVKRGQKVKQGEVIGYVGSTGLSTGPHLHYEMIKNGVKINPLREVLPPGEPIKEENRERFFSEIEKWQEILK